MLLEYIFFGFVYMYFMYDPRLAISRLHSFVADFMLCWNDVSGKDSCGVWDFGIFGLLWITFEV